MKNRKRFIILLLLFWFLFLTITGSCARESKTHLLISAASSLTDILEEIAPLYQQKHPEINLTFNFAASGKLQQQIQQGAPTDVFFSAALDKMEVLQKQGLILPETRKNLLQNQFVLIKPKNAVFPKTITDLNRQSLQKVAVGDFQVVPAGKYAQEVLQYYQLLPEIKSKLVFGNSVRQVFAFVEAGNADCGLVYKTDVLSQKSDRIQVVETLPTESHSPIIYPIAVVRESQAPQQAKMFIQFLTQSHIQELFYKVGFDVLESF